MKTQYALGAVLIGSLAFATTAANASDAQVRFNVHLGIPVHVPLYSPHLYPPVVYYGHPGYHHGHHQHRHHEYRHHDKSHHSGSHWRHYDGHRGHGYASAAGRSQHQGGHGWRGR